MKVIVLKCPQCGAHLDSARTLCDHCGTTVRLTDDKHNFISTGIACPKCYYNNQFEDRHCGNCGENLIIICPVPNCHTENNTWRKYCKKCGKDIIGYHVEMIEKTQAKIVEKIRYHESEIDRIQKQLPSSKRREISIKILIGIIGGLISLMFLSEYLSTQSGGYIFAFIITLLITIGCAAAYHSSEGYNWLASMYVHSEDLERLQENFDMNQNQLMKIKTNPKKI